MAKRQSSDTPENVVRIDGEGKVHGNAGKITPLCKFRGHDVHTWVTTDEDVTCGRCVNLMQRQEENRKRLEYATRVAESQEPGSQHLHPMEDARPNVVVETAKREVARIVERESVVPAVEPVKDSQGETVTIPVDFDNPEAGRRELDASKGERVLCESVYRLRTPSSGELSDIIQRVKARTTDKMTREHIAELVSQEMRGEFSAVLHEPKNGEALSVDIPPLPEGVHPHIWELAHEANTERARDYWMNRAAQESVEYWSRHGDNGATDTD